MTARKILPLFVLATLLALPIASAQALMLDVWNVDELAATDDYVDLQLGTAGSLTTLTVQWNGGSDDSSGALGIDKLFINNTDSSLRVSAVYLDAISAANEVTSAWVPTDGGTQAGGGFGSFVEKVADSAGSGGIAPDSLVFVLDGLYAPASFVPNAAGTSFAVHVRYANGCSGWAADGGRAGGSGSDPSCGGTTAVPEPSAALVFGAGVTVVGSVVRRRR